ncbi:Uu.00g031210.m01.CDS01 [Anthostomella pinea]|uniref:Uu.00g031210.m01.CDS01 n=1 Tax=Anthostomella pinea TaxID=933095 RepID=A0AAI8YD69_9PEZI|nr:Uu.00g031210.m01.CDS01 [Anthostomella pinea]
MEPPSKRLKSGQAPYDSDEEEAKQDELSLTDVQFDARQDPLHALDKGRAKAATRLKSRFEDIFEKYGKDFTGVADEIDFHTGEVVINNGHLQSLEDEKDREREDSPSSEEEKERALKGKHHGPAKQSQPKSLIPANPSTDGTDLVPQPAWNPAVGMNEGACPMSSPAFPSDPFGAANPFAMGPSFFGNHPTDPTWQVPEFPMQFPLNAFGFMGQAMGVSQQLQFNQMAAMMAAGGGPYGYLGGMFQHQGFRKTARAGSLARTSLPATTETPTSDAEEDEILVARSKRDALEVAVAKTAEKSLSLSLAAFNRNSQQTIRKVAKPDEAGTMKMERLKTQRVSGRPKKTTALEHCQPGQPPRGVTTDASVAQGGGKHTATARRGRPKKTNTLAESQIPDQQEREKPTETDHNHPVEPKPAASQDTGSELRRGRGRPNKTGISSSPQTSPSRRQDQQPTGPVDTTQILPPGSPKIAKDNGVRLMQSKELIANHAERLDLQTRRSSRTRKQPDLYGDIPWLKRGARLAGTTAKDCTESGLSQTLVDGSPGLMHTEDSPSAEEDSRLKEFQQGGQTMTDTDALPEPQDIPLNPEHLVDKTHSEPVKFDNDATETLLRESSLQEEMQDRGHINSPPAIICSHDLEPPIIEAAMEEVEPSTLITEVGSQNEVGLSTGHSDKEDEVLVPLPEFLRENTPPVSRPEQLSHAKKRETRGVDISIGRSSPPDDVMEDRIPEVSNVLEPAVSPQASLETTKTQDLPEMSDKEMSQTLEQAPTKDDLAPALDISQRDPDHEEGVTENDNPPSSPPSIIIRADPVPEPMLPPLPRRRSPPAVSALALRPALRPRNDGSNAHADAAEPLKPAPARSLRSRASSSVPVTPKKPRHRPGDHLTSSAKRFALTSLVPDDPRDDDELSIVSSSPSSFRSRLSRINLYSSPAPSPHRTSRRHSLLVGPRVRSSTPDRISGFVRPAAPATDSRASRTTKRKLGASAVQSSPLARTAVENLLATPRRRRQGNPPGSPVRTPGGTMRRCGEDGFKCDRDFCLTCP